MNGNGFTVTSYFTYGTPYADVCHEYLMPSIHKLQLKADIRGVDNLGSWLKNTAYKPEFLRAMMDRHENNIVFLDVDAEVKFYPALFNEIPEDCFVAAHVLDKNAWYGSTYGSNRYELLSGTLWFRNCDESRKLLDDWNTLCKVTNVWEQKLLHQVIMEQGINLFELPLSYCYIDTLPGGRPPLVPMENPIIVHHQVSRQYKRVVG